MLASGLPEKTSLHARNIAQVALDMMDISRDVVVDGNSIKVGIGTFRANTYLVNVTAYPLMSI